MEPLYQRDDDRPVGSAHRSSCPLVPIRMAKARRSQCDPARCWKFKVPYKGYRRSKSASSAVSLRQLSQYQFWRHADSSTDLNKFNDLKAPFATLILSYKRLV